MKKLLTTTLVLALSAPLAPVWAGDEDEESGCKQAAATCAQMMKQKFCKHEVELEHEQVVVVVVVVMQKRKRKEGKGEYQGTQADVLNN